MNKITIIIPVFNAEKYLRRCLDSVLAQTYNNWECILVDDGSKDSSGNICDEYSNMDARIRVIHKENGGVSSARNIGIEQASGKWIGFIDSDDYVAPEFLQNFMELPQDVDLLQQGFISVGAWWEIPDIDQIPIYCENKVVRKREDTLAFINNMMDVDLHPYIWCKLFSRSIIDNFKIRFDGKLNYQEDLLFAFDYYSNIISAANSSKCGYYYIFPQNNKSYGNANPLMVYKQVFQKMNHFFVEEAETERFRVHILQRISHYCFKPESFGNLWFFCKFFMWIGVTFNRAECQKSFKKYTTYLLIKKLYFKNPIVSLLLFTVTFAIINIRKGIKK